MLYALACSNHPAGEVGGRIIQRRITHAGRLMLTFEYSGKDGLVTDSTELENRTIPVDTVRVLPPRQPGEKAVLLIP